MKNDPFISRGVNIAARTTAAAMREGREGERGGQDIEEDCRSKEGDITLAAANSREKRTFEDDGNSVERAIRANPKSFSEMAQNVSSSPLLPPFPLRIFQ